MGLPHRPEKSQGVGMLRQWAGGMVALAGLAGASGVPPRLSARLVFARRDFPGWQLVVRRRSLGARACRNTTVSHGGSARWDAPYSWLGFCCAGGFCCVAARKTRSKP